MTLREEYLYCKENNIDFILTEDKIEEIDNTGKSINGIEDLVMVHKTDYAPNGRINSSLEANATKKDKITFNLNGEEVSYEKEFKAYRNTVHFCMNGQTKSHALLNLDVVKYAVIMPLATNSENIIAGTECDIYTEGGVDLKSDSYILCPKEEIEKIKEENPNSTVIGYEGNTVSLYVDTFISQVLGYKYKEPTQDSRYWNDGFGHDHDVVFDLCEEKGWYYTDHIRSSHMANEQLEDEIDHLIATIQIIVSEQLLFDEKNIEGVENKLYETVNISDGLFKVNNQDNYQYISDRVEEKTGIKLVDKKNPFDEDSELKIMTSKELTSILRYAALTKKHELGTLTDSEKDSYLSSVPFSKLTADEKEYFVEKTNNELKNRVYMGDSLSVSIQRNTDDEIEMVLSFPENFYGVAKDDLLKMIAGATQQNEIYSLSASLRDSNLSMKENFYKFVDFVKDYPNSHIKGITEDGKIITDFAISNNSNFKELEEKSSEYKKSLERCYSGENGFAKETVNKSQVEHK